MPLRLQARGPILFSGAGLHVQAKIIRRLGTILDREEHLSKKPGSPDLGPAGDPNVQASQDSAVTGVLNALEAAIREKIKDGEELRQMSLPELLRELREIIKAAKKSAPSIVFAVPPVIPQNQIPREQESRLRAINVETERPQGRLELLDSQQRFLDRQENAVREKDA